MVIIVLKIRNIYCIATASYTILSIEFSTLLLHSSLTFLYSLMLYLTPPGLVQTEPDDYREHSLRFHLHLGADGPGQVGKAEEASL